MKKIESRELISNLCEEIGKDNLLVQGAGGNISWKDSKTLWVKASGTWLENANTEDIFVPVSLETINKEISNGNFAFKPLASNDSKLKPSIETILHALMKQKYVLHLHAVNVISDIIKNNCYDILNNKIPEKFYWKLIDYHTPGPDLAKSINNALTKSPKTNILFLKNHGLVIAEDTIDGLTEILEKISKIFFKEPINFNKIFLENNKDINKNGTIYKIIDDYEIQLLSKNNNLLKRVEKIWAICPDHVVFLGGKAVIYDDIKSFNNSQDEDRELIFIKNYGTIAAETFNYAKKIQLKCYFNIITRITEKDSINLLSNEEIAKLLNWDAEKYRLSLMT
jgi:rhamnose utilization protein RhaD (predicted bifunctional aldolase and dehydrogenase)